MLRNATEPCDLPDDLMDPPDSRLLEAAQRSEQTNQITPILKEELRARILLQRLKRGEPAINADSDQPIKYEVCMRNRAGFKIGERAIPTGQDSPLERLYVCKKCNHGRDSPYRQRRICPHKFCEL